MDAFEAEAGALAGSLAGLPDAAWARPTRCTPWDVRDLLAHVHVAVARVPRMLAAEAPGDATISAADYYRPDARFGEDANAARVATAQDEAGSGPQVLAAFTETCRRVAVLCRGEPAGRVVRTRHGDPMLLGDFLTTRVVEVAVHGLDLADALAVPSWLTAPATRVLQELLLGPGRTAPDPEHFIRAATGRADDPGLLARLRPRRLALG